MGLATYIPREIRPTIIFATLCLPITMLCFFCICFPDEEPEYEFDEPKEQKPKK